jgi:hypothetical protein
MCAPAGKDTNGSREAHMARGTVSRGRAVGTTQEIISSAVGAAEALTVGVVHLAEVTLVEALHAAQDVGSEIGFTLARATRGSIRAAGEIGGDLADVGRTVTRGVVEPVRELGGSLMRVTNGLRRSGPALPRNGRVRKPLAKARTRRRRRRAIA